MQLTPIIELLRREPWLRPFFLARAQSSLGTGAGYVGLLVLAYDRLESPWAISLILLADFLPTTFLAEEGSSTKVARCAPALASRSLIDGVDGRSRP